MDEQLRLMTNLLKVTTCPTSRDMIQKAIDEHKVLIGYVEPIVLGMVETYDRMKRMVPEMGEDVVFFSDEVTTLLVDYLVEKDVEGMDNEAIGDMLREGCRGYEDYNDIELLTCYMNFYDEDDTPSVEDMKVKHECDTWIAITIEQALLK